MHEVQRPTGFGGIDITSPAFTPSLGNGDSAANPRHLGADRRLATTLHTRSEGGSSMGRLALPAALFAAVLVVVGASPASATWVYNGVPMSSASNYQMNSEIVSDGADGAIVVWEDWSGASVDIYAQKVDSWGDIQWPVNGIAVCTAPGTQMLPKVCTDGAGGAIIVWLDTSGLDWDIKARRIDANGNPLWAATGATVCVSLGVQQNYDICSDGEGGVVVIWEDYRNGNADIMAQRMLADGSTGWVATAVEVCVVPGEQTYPQIIQDGEGGYIAAWKDVRTAGIGIYGQRITSDGTISWGSMGVAYCTVPATGLGWPQLISDGYHGAIVVWHDERTSVDQNIYTQRVDYDGNMLWGPDGTLVCIATGDQRYPVLTSDGDYGAIITWMDASGDYDVYAQRVNANGVPRWTHNGKPVCTKDGYSNQIQITTDDAGGAIIAWQDARLSSQYDLWAQRIDHDGDPVWRVDGVIVCADYPEDQTHPRMIPDTKGGALFCWDDDRNTPYYDVYAMRVERAGYYGYPCPRITSVEDVPGDQGGWVDVTWSSSSLDEDGEPVIDYSVWRKLKSYTVSSLLASGAKGVDEWEFDKAAAGPIYFFEEVGGTTYGWEFMTMTPAFQHNSYTLTIPTLNDLSPQNMGYHYFKVIAHTAEPTTFWESPEFQGNSVDNISPPETSGLSAEQSISPAGLKLTWNSSTAPDLLYYKIYRGTPADLTMNVEIVLATTPDTTYFDD